MPSFACGKLIAGQHIEETQQITDVKKSRATGFPRLAQRRDAHAFFRRTIEQLIKPGVAQTGELTFLAVWWNRRVAVRVFSIRGLVLVNEYGRRLHARLYKREIEILVKVTAYASPASYTRRCIREKGVWVTAARDIRAYGYVNPEVAGSVCACRALLAVVSDRRTFPWFFACIHA